MVWPTFGSRMAKEQKYAVKRWFNFQPHLLSVRTPLETLRHQNHEFSLRFQIL